MHIMHLITHSFNDFLKNRFHEEVDVGVHIMQDVGGKQVHERRYMGIEREGKRRSQ